MERYELYDTIRGFVQLFPEAMQAAWWEDAVHGYSGVLNVLIRNNAFG